MPVHQPLYNSRSTGTYESITTDNGRGLTPAVWRGIDIANRDPGKGFFHLDDFFGNPDAGSITLTQKTAGTAAIIATEALGVLEVDAASATADQGANLQFKAPAFIPSNYGVVAFEAYVRTDDLGTGASGNGQNIVLGLCNVDTSVLASGAIDTSGNGITDYMLFVSISSATTWNAANKWSFRMTRDNSTVSTQMDIGSLVDGDVTTTGWVKLGVRVEPGKSVELYFNGTKVDSDDVSVSVAPNALVVPTFVCESEGTVDPILNVDWYAVGAA